MTEEMPTPKVQAAPEVDMPRSAASTILLLRSSG